MKDAFQTTSLVIGRIAEAVTQIMQIRGELCVLFRVMREQFL
jgi:RNA-binding protein YhbY